MTLNEIAKEIGIVKYDSIPEKMFAYYPIPENRKSELCSIEMIDHLQKKFCLFGDYYDAVKACWFAVQQDEYRKTWLDVVSLYMIDNDYEQLMKIPVLKLDGNLADDLLQLFMHLPSVEAAYTNYVKRGFSEQYALEIMQAYYSSLDHVSRSVKGRPALTGMYFRWLCHYTKANIFRCCGFNFELRTFTDAYILKNKQTGNILPISNDQIIHRSGVPLGSAGATDSHEAFHAQFRETQDAYIGYPVVAHRFAATETIFYKSEWDLLMKPGDTALAIHIPKQANISPENISCVLNEAQTLAHKYYSDYTPKMFFCFSWMLCPDLCEMLHSGANLVRFGNLFTRFPKKSEGKGVFTFVFPQGFNGSLEQLPEDTSLRRAVKQRYLSGGHILDYAGVIEFLSF